MKKKKSEKFCGTKEIVYYLCIQSNTPDPFLITMHFFFLNQIVRQLLFRFRAKNHIQAMLIFKLFNLLNLGLLL